MNDNLINRREFLSTTAAGVSLEVKHRVGQAVTCAKLVNLDTLLVTPGKILQTSTHPMACRTQFAQSVPTARQLFLNYGQGVIRGGMVARVHRVVFLRRLPGTAAKAQRANGAQNN